MTSLENRLVLHRFLCREFGYDDLASMLGQLKEAPARPATGMESEYACQLWMSLDHIDRERFADYDFEIMALSRKLRMDGERNRRWKPHQWLALLFAEHYLRRYFEDPEALRRDLNEAKERDRQTCKMPDYTVDDLRTVAVQSATGSGKTLVMHAHLLQYRRLAHAAGQPPNNVILVTPNEQLSAQHEREFRASQLPARVFSSATGADLLAPVEIIDVNKLAEKAGVKRVAVSDFGTNNLVLVDEGHLGSSGKVWRKLRAELAEGGFTFEYSATFNQIANKDRGLRDTYGKSLLFDYPYRAFHADGYGKDYSISNLPQGGEDENSDMYLLGCLLSFYRQCRIWRDGHAGWTDFNVTRPLWIFLGKTVTGGSNAKANRETRSDVVRILDFLGWVLAQGDRARSMIARLISGDSGLIDATGVDSFAGRFDDLKETSEDALYADICQTLFHGPGKLRVRYLTRGEGELHLRTADNEAFGVVNVGDSAALYKLLDEGDHPDLIIERETRFARPLFADVDRASSSVNIVIGARRFIAGWNSWRVSTMGLMHVGVGEGPEIIQMFGRGVRLMGWNMSLKRHRESGAPSPDDGDKLMELETLRIFGLRANYMQSFRKILETDGIGMERETFPLPVTWNFARKDLKMIRVRKDLRYDRSEDRPVLGKREGVKEPLVEMDLYTRLQVIDAHYGERGATTEKVSVKLSRRNVAFFSRTRIYDRLLARKRQMGWHNLSIPREAMDELLDRDDWYLLHLPPERLVAKSFADMRKLEDVAFELIAEYAARFWQASRRRWELENIEIKALDESDPNNIGEYMLSVDAKKEELIEDIGALTSSLREDAYPRLGLEVLNRDAHAYKPLLHMTEKGKIMVQPVPLDGHEKKVVEKLTDLASSNDSNLQGRELFLIRNLSRGRGVSFFDDHAYYPDFIVWLVGGESQHIIFLDPKGLVRFGPRERRKVALHVDIKDIEERVREKDPGLRLHAYVLSVTPPGKIGDELRPPWEWGNRGVYFLDDHRWAEQVLKDALGRDSNMKSAPPLQGA